MHKKIKFYSKICSLRYLIKLESTAFHKSASLYQKNKQNSDQVLTLSVMFSSPISYLPPISITPTPALGWAADLHALTERLEITHTPLA